MGGKLYVGVEILGIKLDFKATKPVSEEHAVDVYRSVRLLNKGYSVCLYEVDFEGVLRKLPEARIEELIKKIETEKVKH